MRHFRRQEFLSTSFDPMFWESQCLDVHLNVGACILSHSAFWRGTSTATMEGVWDVFTARFFFEESTFHQCQIAWGCAWACTPQLSTYVVALRSPWTQGPSPAVWSHLDIDLISLCSLQWAHSVLMLMLVSDPTAAVVKHFTLIILIWVGALYWYNLFCELLLTTGNVSYSNSAFSGLSMGVPGFTSKGNNVWGLFSSRRGRCRGTTIMYSWCLYSSALGVQMLALLTIPHLFMVFQLYSVQKYFAINMKVF